MGRLITEEDNGYSYVSDSGVVYSLYEGKSIGADSTSDILFIMDDGCTEYSTNLVGWIYGAFTLRVSGEPRNDMVKTIGDIVKGYESKHPANVRIWLETNKGRVMQGENGKIIYGPLNKCVDEWFKRIKFDDTPFPNFSWAVSVDENAVTVEEAYHSAVGWFGCKDIGETFDAPFSLIFNHYGGGGMECMELEEDYLDTTKPLFIEKIKNSSDACGYEINEDSYVIFEAI